MVIRIHMVPKAFRRLFLCSLLPISLTFVAIAIEPGRMWSRIDNHLLSAAGSLMGTTALFLFRSEKHAGSRAVFLNFSFFFLGNGVVGPLHLIIPKWVGPVQLDIHTLMYQYFMPEYFLSLSVSVVYLVIECLWRNSKVLTKYLVTFLVVGIAWTPLFYPFLSNQRYLYETEDMQDLTIVTNTIKGLRSNQQLHPSVGVIVAAMQLDTTKDKARPLTETRVTEMLPYTHGNNYAILFYRPLWRSCALISIFTVMFMIGFLSLRYVSDAPGSAYFEKIAWSVLLYCVLEAIHFYYFMNVTSWEVAATVITVGGFVSLAVMIPLGYLFGLRYVFVNSIEGSYYERQLSRQASRITRWRDVVDNWVIRQFVNHSDLDRRFVVRGGGKASAGQDDPK